MFIINSLLRYPWQFNIEAQLFYHNMATPSSDNRALHMKLALNMSAIEK
jgi:hypothetical protein